MNRGITYPRDRQAFKLLIFLSVAVGNGATVIAQSEETCVVYGMPKGPIEDGIADTIAPLDRIAEEIFRTVK